MRAPRALGRSGEPAHFVSRAAGSARRGGGHVRCLVTTNRSWFLRKASPRTALVAAVQKPPLPLTLLNRLWPDKRAASPSLNAQARVQTPPNIDDRTSRCASARLGSSAPISAKG